MSDLFRTGPARRTSGSFTVSYSGAGDIVKRIQKLKDGGEVAIKRTVSDFTSRGPGWVSKGIREHYGVDTAAIKDAAKKPKRGRTSIRVAGISVDGATLEYKGRTLTPIHFKMSPKARPSAQQKKPIRIPGQLIAGGSPVAMVRPPRKYTVKVTIIKGQRTAMSSDTYVTNTEATAGGGDREEDEAYRERIREAENRLSTAGPAKAYKYWAMTANPLVTDAVVESETETVTRTLPVYDGHAFQGGANLLPETLTVYLPSGAEAMSGTDYTATYNDELLTLSLSGTLADVETVKIEITRNMYGRVKIVPICAGGEIPDEDILADVLTACSADDVRPLTDLVQVEAPTTFKYDIELEYWTTKASESEVVENVEGSGGAIDRYIYWQGSSLDQDINPDYLRKLILCPHWEEGLTGATRVNIIKPVYTELPSTTVAEFSGKLTVSHKVKD